MNHQNPIAVDAFVAALNAATLALLGVNYYAVVWAFLGSLVAMTQMERKVWSRAVLYSLLSTLIGSLMGTATADFLNITNRSALAFLSILGALGWQTFLAICIKIAEGKLKSYLPGATQ